MGIELGSPDSKFGVQTVKLDINIQSYGSHENAY